ncbi:L-glyceraldehyde 3-phosphate reductase [Aquisphaera giovannonii]|uniref:L-glyceraldehyde 3-phosphate reductase n=1 Tax=Aquisphaera giovannonii TaxID=406548 RepID=A0A5B9W9N1_9BACT|nr:aldo/keto reductase [Aquisphaera giovannonii]QEH36949.1 L-glyceraldehyde 3-phosphate reductase [Aquisphaera giovannonii]
MHGREEMGCEAPADLDRRGFLGAGAGLAAAGMLNGPRATDAQEPSKGVKSELIPTRVLGKTGVPVSILSLGTWNSVGLDRILRTCWAGGLRYVDTAASYNSEPAIARWLKSDASIRKDLFLVTKSAPNTPSRLMAALEKNLAALQTDYVDLIFIHAVGDHGGEASIEWPRSKEFKEAAEAIRRSGKAKFVGFSTHHKEQAQILMNAAEGGFVDAIMVRNNPWTAAEAPMNRALDACHKAGIGLISMKQIAGQQDQDQIARNLPELKQKGLSPYQALLHAIWTDERFSAACVSMRNTDQVRENLEAARTYRPMARADILRLRDACIAAGPTFCAGCDGSCSRAAGTEAELGQLTRALTYHEHHGYREEARRLYRSLDEKARDWRGADLEAAREACPNRLDFARLLPRADELLS